MARNPLEIEELIQHDRVAGRIYTDPMLFDREMDQIFSRSWLYVAHETQVPNPGDFFSTWLGLQPVIVARGADDGVVRLFLNRCRHRGNLVCQRESGNARFFRCAYHGWTYDGRGRLAGVPHRHGYGRFFAQGEDLGLAQAAHVGIYRGFVFASLHPDVPPLETWIGPSRRYLDAFAQQGPAGIAVRAGCQKLHYRGNWKFQAENDADNYHTEFTHAVGAEVRSRRARAQGRARGSETPQPESRVRVLGYGHTVNSRPGHVRGEDLYQYAQTNSMAQPHLRALEAQMGCDEAARLLRACDPPPHTFRMFPNLVLIGLQIRVTRPIGVDRSENTYYPVLLEGVPDEVNAIRLRWHEQRFGPAGSVTPDDIEIFARNQLGLQCRSHDWQIMARGLEREAPDEDGLLSSEIKDETGMRHIYQEWKRLMLAPALPQENSVSDGPLEAVGGAHARRSA